MLLRRITHHVKSQNWFAVCIDFVIVVIGVFIGIQVANWNDTRKEMLLAREYVDRIQEDLLANQQDMGMRLDYFSGVRRHALIALKGSKEPANTLDEQFLVSSFVASLSLRRSYQRNTFDELLSAGAMNTIPSVEIRNRVAEYYRVAEGSEYYMNSVPSYTDVLRRTMPYEVQLSLRSGGCNASFSTDASGSIAAHIPKDCPLDISPEKTEIAIEQLLAANLEADLTRALADFDLKIQLFEVWVERSQSLYDYLEGTK